MLFEVNEDVPNSRGSDIWAILTDIKRGLRSHRNIQSGAGELLAWEGPTHLYGGYVRTV